MSSMAMQAIEMGIDPVLAPGGGTWGDCWNSSTGRESYGGGDFKADAQTNSNWFATAQEAQDYAKKHVGTVITRSPDGNGYIIKN